MAIGRGIGAGGRAGRGRLWAAGGAILAAVVLLGSLSLGRGGPARAQDGATPAPDAVPLDLAAVALTSADLEAAGLTGFGVRSGRTPTLGETAATLAGETAPARQALDAAGWWHGYALELASTQAPEAQRPPVAVEVAVRLAEYVTADGAATGFALLEDEAAQVAPGTPTPQDVPGSRTIGDQSEITVSEERAGGATFPAADLAFRSGAVTAGVTVADRSGAAPDVPRLEALADRLLAKIEALRAQGGPNLGTRALRLGGRGTQINDDAYLRLDGRDLPAYGETADETSARAGRLGDTSSAYRVAQRVAAGARGRSDDVVYSTTLHRFVSPAAASAWVRDAQGRLDRTADLQDIQPVADAAALGEESAAFSYGAVRRSGPFRGFVFIVRVGADVAEVRLEALVQAPRAAIDELAQAQADCLAAPACRARTRPPASIAPPPPGTPAAGTPTP